MKLVISAILAGGSIGLGSFLFIIAKTYFGAYGLLIGACLFPIGLIIICLMHWHLFTGKVGLIFRPLLDTDSLPKATWLIIIFIGNYVGASIVGLLVYLLTWLTDDSSFVQSVYEIGSAKSIDISLFSALNMLFKSIVCGIFVYLAVRFFVKGKSTSIKIFGIFLPIMLFVYFGFQHCIANITYLTASTLLFQSIESFSQSVYALTICTCGNSIGAIIIDRLID